MAVSADSGFDLPLCIASVMGGAMFGDNLSFISDTTIAACSTQGTEMKDKFRANFKIALPAALAALALIIVVSLGTDVQNAVSGGHDLVLIIPYVLVLIGGIVGLNVFVVLLIGIAGAAITLITGQVTALELMGNMGGGVSGMFETILVTLLVASCAASSAPTAASRASSPSSAGCFAASGAASWASACWWASWISPPPTTPWPSSWQAPSPRRWRRNTASAPSAPPPCWTPSPASFRASSPYGAQMLVAISTCATLGYAISAFDIIPPAVLPLPAVPVQPAVYPVRQEIKASHFVYLQQEPTFLRRWAL